MDRNTVLDKVFREDTGKILYAIRRAGCPEQDLEDILQQTIVTSLENFDKLKNLSKASAWCVKIAVNITYRKLSRDNRFCVIDFTDEAEEARINENDKYDVSDVDIKRAEIRMDLKKHLNGLAPEYAVPLLLKTVYGLTYEEIADILEIKLGTVRSRISRAKKILEKCLTEDDN
ncbi:MAG: RNA polymerase sigma factor [Bacillota bacterium]|nr:RNA polymerase sigma factor [Bacillota bacterium]